MLDRDREVTLALEMSGLRDAIEIEYPLDNRNLLIPSDGHSD